MKESIFENGYLKAEFINPNYRGLVGWPCRTKKSGTYSRKWSADKLLMVFTGQFKTEIWTESAPVLRIPQFTPADIPVGELCWLGEKHTDENSWELEVLLGEDRPLALDGTWTFIVPYLIAETAEKAEELKDWWE